jgi:hypothetical protein
MGLVILFVVLAAIFGLGGVIEGLLWAVVIAAVLLIVAVVVGLQALGGDRRRGL